jgi:hypothetical protein
MQSRVACDGSSISNIIEKVAGIVIVYNIQYIWFIMKNLISCRVALLCMPCIENVTYDNVFVSSEHGDPVIVCCDVSCIGGTACKASQM